MSVARAACSQPVSVDRAEPCTWGCVSLHAGSVTAPGHPVCLGTRLQRRLGQSRGFGHLYPGLFGLAYGKWHLLVAQ